MVARNANLFAPAAEPAASASPVVVVSFARPSGGFWSEALWRPRRGQLGALLRDVLQRPALSLYAARYGCRDVAVCAVDLAPPERPLAYVDGVDMTEVRAELAHAREAR